MGDVGREAGGLRRSRLNILTEDEINYIKTEIKTEIKQINADESKFLFNQGYRTGYLDEDDTITVRGDILPDTYSINPRDIMSVRAVLAHEYYGHRSYRGTALRKGSWNDEFRASYMAAKIAPGLSDDDRGELIIDAVKRANEAGVSIKHNAFMRRVLYGFNQG